MSFRELHHSCWHGNLRSSPGAAFRRARTAVHDNPDPIARKTGEGKKPSALSRTDSVFMARITIKRRPLECGVIRGVLGIREALSVDFVRFSSPESSSLLCESYLSTVDFIIAETISFI